MKKIIVLLLSLILAFSASSVNHTKGRDQKQDDKPFEKVDVMPRFTGGDAAMQKYIQDNLKYPAEAVKKGISGRVSLKFVVSATGEIKEVKVIRGIEPAMDAEAKRVVEAMPKWVPGQNKGKNVAVNFVLPIYFKLNKSTKSTNVK